MAVLLALLAPAVVGVQSPNMNGLYALTNTPKQVPGLFPINYAEYPNAKTEFFDVRSPRHAALSGLALLRCYCGVGYYVPIPRSVSVRAPPAMRCRHGGVASLRHQGRLARTPRVWVALTQPSPFKCLGPAPGVQPSYPVHVRGGVLEDARHGAAAACDREAVCRQAHGCCRARVGSGAKDTAGTCQCR